MLYTPYILENLIRWSNLEFTIEIEYFLISQAPEIKTLFSTKYRKMAM